MNVKGSENINKIYNFKSKITGIFKIPEIGVLIPILILFLLFTSFDTFFITPVNLAILGKTMAYKGIIVIGMAYLIIVGQIDLSVGSVATMIAVIAGTLIVKMGIPIWISFILSLLAAILVGLVNGVLSVKFKIPSIIVTLGMMFAAKGGITIISKGKNIYPLPESLVNFGKATPLGVSWNFFIFIVLVIISDFILRKTIIGRKIYATGANVLVARINGINTNLVKILIHVLTSFLAGLAGILYMINMGSAAMGLGESWELPVIAGTIIGGVSLLGGFGTVWGAFLGMGLITVINNGFITINVRPEVQTIIIGILMISAAGFDIWRRNNKRV